MAKSKNRKSKPARAIAKDPFKDIFSSHIVGTIFQFKDMDKYYSVLEKLVVGTKVRVIPEPENPHDENACAVFLRQKRIGYLPRKCAKRFLKRYNAKERFDFYIYHPIAHADGSSGITTIIGFLKTKS